MAAPQRMFDFGVQIFPPAKMIAADFRALGVDIRSFREPLNRAIRHVAVPSIGDNFELGGRPAWASLADSTVTERSRLGFYADQILVRSGALAKAAQQYNIWEVSSTDAYIRGLPERVAYGIPLNEGFTNNTGAWVAPRPFMMLQPEDIDAIEEIFVEWIQERFSARGFNGVSVL